MSPETRKEGISESGIFRKWPVEWLLVSVGWVGEWLLGWVGGWLRGWVVGWVGGWVGGRLVSWLAGRLAGWLVQFGLTILRAQVNRAC